MRSIPVRALREEVDFAIWEMDHGEAEPHEVVYGLLFRLRALRSGGWIFRLRRLLRLDRGGIAWD
jgi:hypothetical protein